MKRETKETEFCMLVDYTAQLIQGATSVCAYKNCLSMQRGVTDFARYEQQAHTARSRERRERKTSTGITDRPCRKQKETRIKIDGSYHEFCLHFPSLLFDD